MTEGQRGARNERQGLRLGRYGAPIVANRHNPKNLKYLKTLKTLKTVNINVDII